MEGRENSQEEDAEDVSLCDLPVMSLIKVDHDQEEEEKKKKNECPNDEEEAANDVLFEAQEEFAFGSVTGGSLSTAPAEMCAADEVFFRGQILPLHLSFSNDVCPIRSDPTQDFRSECMDRGSVAGFRSMSSRSSSCSSRSTQNSSSITSGTLTSITRVTSEPKLRPRNQFNTHPSPKPQIRVSSARRLERVSSAGRKQKSSMWDLFRLGLVRTPNIELQEIKANLHGNSGNKCTNYSSSTRSSSVNHNDCNTNDIFSGVENMNNNNNDNSVEKQKRRKSLSGCMCTADQIALNVIVNVKSKEVVNKENKGEMKLSKGDETTSIKMKKSSVRRQSGDHDHQKKKKQSDQGLSSSRKQAMSHHRTYEWLKELSQADLPMHV